MDEAMFMKQGCSAPKQPTLYEEHNAAVIEYYAACRAWQDASARREQALAHLQKVTQVLQDAVSNALYDPTIPAPAVPMQPPGNGQIHGVSAGQLNPPGIYGGRF